jgi:hypothetical protein
MYIGLSHRWPQARRFASRFLLGYSQPASAMAATDYAGNPIGFTASGLKRVLDGPSFFGVPRGDARVPDLIGVVQHGVVYTGHTAKIAEHGGQDAQDRHVPLLVWGHGLTRGLVTAHVETTEIAPTILHLLGLDPRDLQAVRAQGTPVLPQQ